MGQCCSVCCEEQEQFNRQTEFPEQEEHLREEQQRVTELREQLRTNEQEMEQMRRQLADQQGQLRTNEQEMQQIRGRLADQQGQLRTNEQEMQQMRRQLADQQGQLEELQRHWVISRNEIQVTSQLLGQGAWGRVWRGKFRGYDVAVKEMYENIMSDHNRCLFEREANIASKCHHPCLLLFIGATADDNPPLLVTEIMDCSLRDKLYNDHEPPLPTEGVSVISLDVARALNYLHQKPNPIIHSDISSANVLLWRHGNQWRGKVSDYGTANFVRQSTRNDAGAIIYCAPELVNEATDHPIISCKVDVYSFGVLLCEMCIRKQPDQDQRRRQINQMERGMFRHLVGRCVEEEPGDRPNMEEIINNLERSMS